MLPLIVCSVNHRRLPGDPYGRPGHGDPDRRTNIVQGLVRFARRCWIRERHGRNERSSEHSYWRRWGAAAPVGSVEILSKSGPAYTEEARRPRLEGEALLQVVLRASGEVQVIRVVRGLGHGLDESEVRAAQQINLKPARRHGTPVDSPALMRIVFQIAY